MVCPSKSRLSFFESGYTHQLVGRQLKSRGGENSKLSRVTGCGKGFVLSPIRFSVLFVAAVHAMLVRFIKGPDILRALVHLQEDGVEGNPKTSACIIHEGLSGAYFTPTMQILSLSQRKVFAKSVTSIVTVFEAAGLSPSEKRTKATPGNDTAPGTLT